MKGSIEKKRGCRKQNEDTGEETAQGGLWELTTAKEEGKEKRKRQD